MWVVETDDGRRYMLDGEVPEGLSGKRVKVHGAASGASGIGMAGDVLAVRKIVRA